MNSFGFLPLMTRTVRMVAVVLLITALELPTLARKDLRRILISLSLE